MLDNSAKPKIMFNEDVFECSMPTCFIKYPYIINTKLVKVWVRLYFSTRLIKGKLLPACELQVGIGTRSYAAELSNINVIPTRSHTTAAEVRQEGLE